MKIKKTTKAALFTFGFIVGFLITSYLLSGAKAKPNDEKETARIEND